MLKCYLVSRSHAANHNTSGYRHHGKPRHKYICSMLVRTAVKEHSHQRQGVLEGKEHPPYQIQATYNKSCSQFIQRLIRHKLLVSAQERCFVFPRSFTHLLMRKSECHECYIISSDWESAHRCSLETLSAV